MRDQWGSQSERWHFAMRQSAAASDAERLAEAIGAEIRAGVLPPGAVLPMEGRLAVDLRVAESVVGCAYEHLKNAGLLAMRSDQRVCVAGAPARVQPDRRAGATIVPFERSRRTRDAGEDST